VIRRAIILVHAPGEGPGRIAGALCAAGWRLELRRLHGGDAVPRALADGELLVVMGGPMGVADRGDPRYPFLADELDLLRRAIAEDRPVLGVCLGAQLLAAAAGAEIGRNRHRGRPRREVGWADVHFAGAPAHPELCGMPAAAPMLHWHEDAFALPPGAALLAWSDRCPHQAFRLGRAGRPGRQAGVQFHPEVDAATVARWARADARFVIGADGAGAVGRLLRENRRQEARSRTAATRLIGNLIRGIASGAP
jgi:GMP synthase (glutamine-hydrolysing)